MQTTIYFRASFGDDTKEELEIAKKHFNVVQNRMKIKKNNLVIPRYSALPFYKELEQDMIDNKCKLINTFEMHNYVANILNYYYDLKEYTPKTYENWINLPRDKSFIVKGLTNSKKFEWNTKMFAKTYLDVPKIAMSLMDDDLIRDQGIIVREYIPLKKLSEGINGLPISNEWRTFVLNGKIVETGFYWSNEADCKPYNELPTNAKIFLQKVINIVKDKINFFVIDIAETQSGDWIVIELNDGQMSGLSEINPDNFYKNLKNLIN